MEEVFLTDAQFTRIIAARDDPPADRLLVLWEVFEHSTGTRIGRPPSPNERRAVSEWMRRILLSGPTDQISTGPPWMHHQQLLGQSVYGSVPEKERTLVQFGCPACQPICRPDGTFELAITMPLDVPPWSQQSTPGHMVIRESVRQSLKANRWLEVYRGEALCVRISSLIGARRNLIDADNVVKGVLDAMEDAVYENDRAIQYLTSRRLTHAGDFGSYSVSVWGVYPFSEDVVFDDPGPRR